MPPELLFAMQGSLGVAVGVFLGLLIGLTIRARNGKTTGLFRGSVFGTAIIGSGLAFGASVLIRLITGG
ncbi:MAG: hypothetical protein ACRBBK_00860 [Paracoccaceae bacterium]